MKRDESRGRRTGSMRPALDRDLQRRERRRPGTAEFWRSLRVLGMVGWPIVLSAVGGAWLGRMLDRRFETGHAWTLALLSTGVVFGCFVAWRAIKD